MRLSPPHRFFKSNFNFNMKFNTLTLSLALFGAWCFLTNGKLDPNNPPAARTGAPGETTCGASGCHSGGTFAGTVAISGVPDTIEANKSYTVTLTQTSNAVRGGFELTCLDGSLAKCGTLTTGTGTSVTTSSGRQYVRQSTPKNLSAGSVSWTFTWKSPATVKNDSLRFYFVSLASNNNGKESGDNPLLGNKKVVLRTSSATSTPEEAAEWVKIYPTRAHEVLSIDLLGGVSAAQIVVFDVQGKQVLATQLSGNSKVDISELKPGIYVAQLAAKGHQAIQKFVVE